MSLPGKEVFNSLRTIALACWKCSHDKGWHKEQTVQGELIKAISEYALHKDTKYLYKIQQDATEVFVRTRGVPVMEKLMLIATEVAEAAEIYRDKKFDLDATYQENPDTKQLKAYEDDTDVPAKPEGFGSELADIVIRVFDLAESLSIDISAEIERKMRYNNTREFRHGGKVA